MTELDPWLGLEVVFIAFAFASCVVLVSLAFRSFQQGDDSAGALYMYGGTISGCLGGFLCLLAVDIG